MKTVGNFPDLASARVAQSLLESSEIEATIPDEFLSGVDWQMNTALHGIRLQVAPQDEDEARLILESALPDALAADALPSADKCPNCRSSSIGPPKWRRRFKAATLFIPILLILYPFVAMGAKTITCYSCGSRWRDDE